MKNLLFLFLTAFLFSTRAAATECVDWYVRTQHVDLYLCQNGTGFTESLNCLYSGRAKALDDYIGGLIAQGLLENKKVSIEIYDQVLTYSHLELNWNDTSYVITVSGYPDLERLAAYVLYFTRPDKKPVTFDYEYYNRQSDSAAIVIDRFNKRLHVPQLKTTRDTTWQQDEACLIYENDEQHYFLSGRKLAVKANGNLPVKAYECWIFLQQDKAYAFRKGMIVATFSVPPDFYFDGDFGVKLRHNNVDFCDGGCPDNKDNPDENVLFRFVYSRNVFHAVAKAKH